MYFTRGELCKGHATARHGHGKHFRALSDHRRECAAGFVAARFFPWKLQPAGSSRETPSHERARP